MLFKLLILFAEALLVTSVKFPTDLATALDKIDTSLEDCLKNGDSVNIFVSFYKGTEGVLESLSDLQFESRGEKITAIYKALVENAESSQTDTLEELTEKFSNVKSTSFWISNQIYIEGADGEMIFFLASVASLQNISKIYKEPVVHLDVELHSISESNDTISPNAEWGVAKIQAEAAWNTPGGNNGMGAVVGIIDSGVRRTHNALVNNYFGNYGWYDAYQKTSAPFDDLGHGTHVTGTIAGSSGLGVAPGAKWMACKALKSDNSGTSAALLACGQFFTCPTDTQGNNPNCGRAPHIVSNSWTANGNGGGVTWFNPVLSAWHSAGIIPVFANGNSGTACSTGMSPADQNVIAVGATTSSDQLSSFSSVGPSYYNEIKPEVVGPGTSVRSAYSSSDTATAVMSGTSMACPHVAGVIALLRSRNPQITYSFAKSILQGNTDKSNLVSQGRTCGGIRDSQFPNNHFGYGRINALKSLRALIGQK